MIRDKSRWFAMAYIAGLSLPCVLSATGCGSHGGQAQPTATATTPAQYPSVAQQIQRVESDPRVPANQKVQLEQLIRAHPYPPGYSGHFAPSSKPGPAGPSKKT